MRVAAVPVAAGVRALAFTLASLSIGSLLVYFGGLQSFRAAVTWMLPLEVVGLAMLLCAAPSPSPQRLLAALAAGCVATLAYDVVRLPLVWSGVPVFQAIAYFGTVILDVGRPTVFSDVVGWAYHLSNGVSFAVMYAFLVRAPGLASAVLWGLTLEAVMLWTPYAEVFSYTRSQTFLMASIGGHVAYGVGLWVALRRWWVSDVSAPPFRPRHRIATAALAATVGIALVAVDFRVRWADAIPASPPPRLGGHLYVSWDVPEPDRVAGIWVLTRFVDSAAHFHFVSPFSPLRYGEPFDVPEANVRRGAAVSVTETLVERLEASRDDRLKALVAAAHISEISPWTLPSHPDAAIIVGALQDAARGACGERLTRTCLASVLARVDHWYAEGRWEDGVGMMDSAEEPSTVPSIAIEHVHVTPTAAAR